jgi:hypothetical protein
MITKGDVNLFRGLFCRRMDLKWAHGRMGAWAHGTFEGGKQSTSQLGCNIYDKITLGSHIFE